MAHFSGPFLLIHWSAKVLFKSSRKVTVKCGDAPSCWKQNLRCKLLAIRISRKSWIKSGINVFFKKSRYNASVKFSYQKYRPIINYWISLLIIILHPVWIFISPNTDFADKRVGLNKTLPMKLFYFGESYTHRMQFIGQSSFQQFHWRDITYKDRISSFTVWMFNCRPNYVLLNIIIKCRSTLLWCINHMSYFFIFPLHSAYSRFWNKFMIWVYFM